MLKCALCGTTLIHISLSHLNSSRCKADPQLGRRITQAEYRDKYGPTYLPPPASIADTPNGLDDFLEILDCVEPAEITKRLREVQEQITALEQQELRLLHLLKLVKPDEVPKVRSFLPEAVVRQVYGAS